ncbi:MAG: transglutaminase [Pirellulaceae bacterium]|nr:MAG: transglutaminase [Pirellulaceae bacterium]
MTWRKLPACESNPNSTNGEQGPYPTARVDTLLLVLIASATWTVVRVNAAWNPASTAVHALCELVITTVVAFVLRRHARTLPQARCLATIAVMASVVYPLAADLAMRSFAEGSEPFEMLMLTGLELSAVVLAVFSHVPRLGGAAVLLSSFLSLFVMTMTKDRLALLLTAVYGMWGLWWLMGAYWDRLAGALVASQVERRIPVRVSVIGGTGIVLLLLATLIGTTGVSAVSLHGFMPTSGGTQWHDSHARSGVGDGDAMVAAKDEAMSFGPVESDLFLDSDMPTLYDMFNDMYGEPPKPKKKLERNIGLAPSEVKETEQQIAKTERNGREFSAVRRNVERRRQTLDDLKAPAMLYVVGRVPLHLALERFDTFDGRVWTHAGATENRPTIRLETQHDKPWAYLMSVGSSFIHRGMESHAVKIINLKTNRFPSPPQLTAVHVDKVDQPEFFGWTDDGVACMPVRDHIPQLTVIHLRSQGVNLQPLRGASFPLAASEQTTTQVGSAFDLDIDRFTIKTFGSQRQPPLWRRSPVENSSRNWQQVEAVVEWLRTEFVLDPNCPAPEDCPDVVAYFLHAKRGPDYLFATTAAVLLRELGYQTRLVTGFYARRDRFDRRAGQTTVLPEDVHVWVEVGVDENTWLAIEPTPGYEPPRESLTWRQWATIAMRDFGRWFVEHLAVLVGVSVLFVLLFVARCVWLDAVAVGVCEVMGLRSSRARLRWTMRLLEWRAWLAGCPRPRRHTIAAWYSRLADNAPPDLQLSMNHFLCWADRLLYAPTGIDPSEDATVKSVCRFVAAACTRQHLARNLCHFK